MAGRLADVKPRPNFLWISFEDTSPRFGCFGDAVARTPCTDALAAGGVVFPNAFSTAPVCAPSRFAVITGQYATHAGAHHMRTPHTYKDPRLVAPYEVVPPSVVRPLPEIMRAAGYFCTNNQKTDYQFTAPATTWDRHSTSAHWRDRPDPDQPFFAVFNLGLTHESRMWDEHWEGRKPVTDPAAVRVPASLPDTPRVRESMARLYDNIAARDAELGRLLAQLEEDGLADSTVVMVWSDHGEGLPRAKRWPGDAGTRVPLVVRAPGLTAGAREPRLVSLLDLAPTVLSLAGLEVPAWMHGDSFLDPAAPPREYAFATRDRYDTDYDQMRSVRDDRYRYVLHRRSDRPRQLYIPYGDVHPAMQELWRLEAEGKLEGPARFVFSPRPVEELFDTQADPDEVNNLARDPAHRAIRDRLRGTLEAWSDRYDRFRDTDELAMVHGWWSGPTVPTTHAPDAYAYGADAVAVRLTDGMTLAGPVLLLLHSYTEGACLGWNLGADSAPTRPYNAPIRLEPGPHDLVLGAHRLGFRPAEPVRLRVTVT